LLDPMLVRAFDPLAGIGTGAFDAARLLVARSTGVAGVEEVRDCDGDLRRREGLGHNCALRHSVCGPLMSTIAGHVYHRDGGIYLASPTGDVPSHGRAPKFMSVTRATNPEFSSSTANASTPVAAVVTR